MCRPDAFGSSYTSSRASATSRTSTMDRTLFSTVGRTPASQKKVYVASTISLLRMCISHPPKEGMTGISQKSDSSIMAKTEASQHLMPHNSYRGVKIQVIWLNRFAI